MNNARLERLVEFENSASDTILKSLNDVERHNQEVELARQDMIDALVAGKALNHDGLTVMFKDSIKVYKYDNKGFFDRVANYEWDTVSAGKLLRFIVTLSRI